MPPLPRGTCPYCNTDVPLRKGDLVREHKDPRHPLHKIGQVDRVPTCPGSGKPSNENCLTCGRPSMFGFSCTSIDGEHTFASEAR